MPDGPLADLLIGEGRSRSCRKTGGIGHHFFECGILLDGLARNPLASGQVEINVSDFLAVARHGFGRDLPLRDGHRGGPCPEDPGTRELWIRDCLFEYGIRLSVLDDSQGRSRKI